MHTTGDPAGPEATDLSLELEVHKGMTKTSHKVKERATLKFRNKSKDEVLRIESEDVPPPFMVSGYANAQSGFDVPKNDQKTVTVSSSYVVGMRFTYTARIGDSNPEDPIVIIDRR